jgi:ABC-type multidrug transport system ATPase subunit
MPLVAAVRNLSKVYRKPGTSVEVAALRSINLEFVEGEYTAIMGASGSGKSTLMNLIGCLDRPSSGQYILGDEDISQLDDDRLSEIRSKRIGFIFQQFNLIQQLTVLENLEVPMFYLGIPPQQRRERAMTLAPRWGSRSACTTARWSCRAASSSACASRGRWSTTRSSSSPTSPPARSTARPASRFSRCSTSWWPAGARSSS